MTCGHDDSTINIVMGIIIIIIIIIALSLRKGGGGIWYRLPPCLQVGATPLSAPPPPGCAAYAIIMFYRLIVSDSTYHCREESRVMPAVGLDADECHQYENDNIAVGA